MTPFEEEVLFACLPSVHAWRMLHDPQAAGNLDAEGMYDLCLAAGFSEEAALSASKDRELSRLRREELS